MDLRDVREQILLAMFERALFLVRGYPMSTIGAEVEELSELFQGFAICHLLVDADSNRYRKHLLQSGQVRRHFLRKSREQGNTGDRHLALSRCEAFLDSLAGGDLELARDIAALSLKEWDKDWEYEDDFCFLLFLHTLVRQPGSLPLDELQAILDRFERALEGGPSTRLPVCRALLARDSGAFVDALQALLQAKQEEIDKKRPSIVDSRFLFWPRSFVSVEGLALLRCAEILEMQVAGDFPLCPPEARLDLLPSPFPDLFVQLDQLSAQASPG